MDAEFEKLNNEREYAAKDKESLDHAVYALTQYKCGTCSQLSRSFNDEVRNALNTLERILNDYEEGIKDIDAEILDYQDNCDHDFVYEKEEGNDTVYVCTKCGERRRKNSVEKAREILEQQDEQVVLYCKSEKGDRDWYGDFSYMDNPLEHYQKSKMCDVEYDEASGHGWGIAGITVKTTMSFIKMMGWEKDLKYRVK